MKQKCGRALRWYVLLNKRLVRKVSFLVILLAVPLLVGAMQLASGGDSGILTIALNCGSSDDGLAEQVLGNLEAEHGILRYERYAGPEEARAAVLAGKADAAWLFSDGLQENIDSFVAGKSAKPVLTIVEREDNVLLQLTREKLYAALYPSLSYSVYREFVRENLSDDASEAELQDDYSAQTVTDSLVEFSFMDAGTAPTELQSSYLVAPLRGLLALMIVLGGLAAGIYLMQDTSAGRFLWLRRRGGYARSVGYLLIPILDMAAVVYVSLLLSGVFTSWRTELPLLLLYCAAVAGFCNLVRLLCGSEGRLSAAIPLILMVMLVLCPVFLNVRRLRAVQYLLPTFYYLHAVHSRAYFWKLGVYTAAVLAAGWPVSRWKQRKTV